MADGSEAYNIDAFPNADFSARELPRPSFSRTQDVRGLVKHVRTVAWSCDGKKAATGGEYKEIQVWDESVCRLLGRWDIVDLICSLTLKRQHLYRQLQNQALITTMFRLSLGLLSIQTFWYLPTRHLAWAASSRSGTSLVGFNLWTAANEELISVCSPVCTYSNFQNAWRRN